MKPIVALAFAALAACVHRLELEAHPLAGRIWDARAGAFVSQAELFDRAARARHVILGETHDNPEHHRLELAALEALAARGGARVLALEQLDTEYQAAADAAIANGVDAEALADAAHFNRQGWDWPLYRPLVQFALEHRWAIAAANLSRAAARAIVADPSRSGLAAPPQALRAALERDIIDAHCGAAPDGRRLAGMVEAQRARDAQMARVVARANPRSVLITGNGHARRDRGVPLYLDDGDVLSIAFLEVQPGRDAPRAYLDGFAGVGSYDHVWFTARAPRKDPCG
jgi:uncharacterized iron-regulated protein